MGFRFVRNPILRNHLSVLQGVGDLLEDCLDLTTEGGEDTDDDDRNQEQNQGVLNKALSLFAAASIELGHNILKHLGLLSRALDYLLARDHCVNT